MGVSLVWAMCQVKACREAAQEEKPHTLPVLIVLNILFQWQ